MAYIINSYDKYNSWDRSHQRKTFEINDNWYAVYEVELEWGVPQLQELVDRDNTQDAKQMHIYDTYEDAMQFVLLMKRLN